MPPSSAASSLTPIPFIHSTYCSTSTTSALLTHLAAHPHTPSHRLRLIRPAIHHRAASSSPSSSSSTTSTTSTAPSSSSPAPPILNNLPQSRLNPAPDDYAAPNFADKADLTLYAGRGGNGCVSFLREAFLPDGPPNGGDGGHGGNVYIQAVPGETSLHKLARRRFIRAGRGQHGQGSARSGTRGDDVVISVPVGTIVRELERRDPAADEAVTFRAWHVLQKQRRREQREQQEQQEQQQRLDKARREAAELKESSREHGAEEYGHEDEQDVDYDNDNDNDNDNDGGSGGSSSSYTPRGSSARREAASGVRGGERATRGKERGERGERGAKGQRADPEDDYDPDADDPQRRKWLLYPGMSKSETRSAAFPKLPRRTQIYQQPPAPIYLDLSRPTRTPILLAAGGIGGLGNPHFTSRDHPRPVFATRGDDAITLSVSLELKLLADVGLVGLPNAGKSTLLRALTNSRTRVGSWAFTTLQPNIGTVVLDRYSGRPAVRTATRQLDNHNINSTCNNNNNNNNNKYNTDDDVDSLDNEIRTRFTVADIPGLVEGAHLDRGLGIAFLRHVERAAVLAFVVDLAAGDAVHALKALWREVALYAEMREDEDRARELEARVDWSPNPSASPSPSHRPTVNLMDMDFNTNPNADPGIDAHPSQSHHPPTTTTIAAGPAGKPWFVVATKADLPHTQANFRSLRTFIDSVAAGHEPHPSGAQGAWTKRCAAIPVSAIHGQGVDRIVHWTVGLLDE